MNHSFHSAYAYPHGEACKLPLPPRSPSTLGELLALPRLPLPGGPSELVWGRGLGGVYQRPLPELRGGWRDDPATTAELVVFGWFNAECPEDHEPTYRPDHRRYVTLGLLLHAGEPACLVLKSGREGDDDVARWIVNPLAFAAILQGQGVRARPWSKLTARSSQARPTPARTPARWFFEDAECVCPFVRLHDLGWTHLSHDTTESEDLNLNTAWLQEEES